MLLLPISFIAGVLTVLAPCILPLLPVIVGGTLSDGGAEGFNKKKALTIVVSLGVSVIAFTLLLKAGTLFIDIPEYVWKWISGGIVIFLGLVTLFPSLWENQLVARLSSKSNILLGEGNQKKSFWGDVVVGAALGPVFSTCSPTYFIVLATVLPVSPALGILYLLAYTAGLCLSLLTVSIVGQKIMNKLGVAADPGGWFKRILGVTFLIVGIAIIGGFDKKTQLFLLDAGLFDVTKIEQRLLGKNTVPETGASIKGSSMEKDSGAYLTIEQKQTKYKKAPELSSINGYINTDGKPITLESLKGKVVLLDIWTYSCINCQRTIPYINEWYKKYKDQGLEVVGLHTPEFAFEKVQTNVEKAVQGFNIRYPVVLDNDYSTWNALGNQFWPRKYIIDIDGYIIYDHIGEGAYEETEKVIQNALKESAARLGMGMVATSTVNMPAPDLSAIQSPETYFGSDRNVYLGNGNPGMRGTQTFALPSAPRTNTLYLGGNWNITSDYAESGAGASVLFKYSAHDVYMVATNSSASVRIKIMRDSKPVGTVAGADVDPKTGEAVIDGDRLYKLIHDPSPGTHTIEIRIEEGTLKAYTFTFG